MWTRNTLRRAMSSSRPTNDPSAPRWFSSVKASITCPSLISAASACARQSLRIMARKFSFVNWFSFSMRCSLKFFLLFLSLGLHPGLEFPDGIALHRQLDMGVEGIDFFPRGVAHEGLPHVLHDTRFHEPSVEGVTKIVKAGI